jgi:hypothetical protein
MSLHTTCTRENYAKLLRLLKREQKMRKRWQDAYTCTMAECKAAREMMREWKRTRPAIVDQRLTGTEKQV